MAKVRKQNIPSRGRLITGSVEEKLLWEMTTAAFRGKLQADEAMLAVELAPYLWGWAAGFYWEVVRLADMLRLDDVRGRYRALAENAELNRSVKG